MADKRPKPKEIVTKLRPVGNLTGQAAQGYVASVHFNEGKISFASLRKERIPSVARANAFIPGPSVVAKCQVQEAEQFRDGSGLAAAIRCRSISDTQWYR